MSDSMMSPSERSYFKLYRLISKIMNDTEMTYSRKERLIQDSYEKYSSITKTNTMPFDEYRKLIGVVVENDFYSPANAEHFVLELIKLSFTR
jgi:hypothetical protein